MKPSQLALADELEAIRNEIARLRSRERALAAMAQDFPKVPVFRRPFEPRNPAGAFRTAMTAAHA